jgi:replicative DNA helicase
MASQAIYSIDREKEFLSAAIRDPGVVAGLPFKLKADDFSPTNRVVFSALEGCIASLGNKEFSKHTLIARLEGMSIKIGDVISPDLYVNSLDLLGVSSAAAVGIAREIKKISLRRKLHSTAIEIAKYTEKDPIDEKTGNAKSPTEIVQEVTKTFNSQINILGENGEDEPKDLFGGLEEFLNKQNAFETKAIELPYKRITDMYGYMDGGSLWCVASRMKVGKTTLWLSTLQQLARNDKEDRFRAFVLDTELSTEENQSRALAAISGVKEFFIRRKTYKKNKEMKEKVEAAAKILKPLENKLTHYFCGGKTLEEQVSAIRRWAAKTLVDGKIGLVVLDYIKLNSTEDFNNKNPLFLTVGAKVDRMKNLAKELDIPIWIFCQTNRENEDSKDGQKIRNSSVIGGSDMIAQFSSTILLLERIPPEEKVKICTDVNFQFTHSLRAIETRQLGPNEMGLDCSVKYQDDRGKDRYCQNYVLFNFSNFNVTEVGTFKDALERQKSLGIKTQPDTPDNDRKDLL